MLTPHQKTTLDHLTVLASRKNHKDSHSNLRLCQIRQINSSIPPLRVEAHPQAQ